MSKKKEEETSQSLIRKLSVREALEIATTGGAGNAKIGTAIAKAGIESYDKKRQEFVISLVEELVRQKAAVDAAIELANRQMGFIVRKFEALEKGEFKLTPQGWIIWDDKELVGIAQS